MNYFDCVGVPDLLGIHRVNLKMWRVERRLAVNSRYSERFEGSWGAANGILGRSGDGQKLGEVGWVERGRLGE